MCVVEFGCIFGNCGPYWGYFSEEKGTTTNKWLIGVCLVCQEIKVGVIVV